MLPAFVSTLPQNAGPQDAPPEATIFQTSCVFRLRVTLRRYQTDELRSFSSGFAFQNAATPSLALSHPEAVGT